MFEGISTFNLLLLVAYTYTSLLVLPVICRLLYTIAKPVGHTPSCTEIDCTSNLISGLLCLLLSSLACEYWGWQFKFTTVDLSTWIQYQGHKVWKQG